MAAAQYGANLSCLLLLLVGDINNYSYPFMCFTACPHSIKHKNMISFMLFSPGRKKF